MEFQQKVDKRLVTNNQAQEMQKQLMNELGYARNYDSGKIKWEKYIGK